jgi:hypothetical protein
MSSTYSDLLHLRVAKGHSSVVSRLFDQLDISLLKNAYQHDIEDNQPGSLAFTASMLGSIFFSSSSDRRDWGRQLLHRRATVSARDLNIQSVWSGMEYLHPLSI